jgi:hypothetical protein
MLEITSLWKDIPTPIGDLLFCIEEETAIIAEIQRGRGFQDDRPLLRTIAKPPCGSRYYFKKLQRTRSQSATYARIIQEIDHVCQLAFSNNDYLLALRNITEKQQQTTLRSYGIIYTEKTMKSMKHGKYRTASFMLPASLAAYHCEPLSRFITQDYAALKLKPIHDRIPDNMDIIARRIPSELIRTYNLSDPPIK